MEILWNGLVEDSSLGERLKRAGDGVSKLRVEVTADFERSVKSVPGHESFSEDRVSGVVAAKTVGTPEGSKIILNASVFDLFSMDEIERIVRHETGHVLTSRRGEKSVERCEDDLFGDYEKRMLGIEIIDEYRAELHAVQSGYARKVDYLALEDFLADVNAEVVNAVLTPHENFLDLVAAIWAPLKRSTKHLAVLAANISSESPASRAGKEAKDHWADYFEDVWDALVTSLRPIPSSANPCDDMGVHLSGLVRVVDRFVDRFGFKFVTKSDGFGFVRTGSNELFTSRVARAERDLKALQQ